MTNSCASTGAKPTLKVIHVVTLILTCAFLVACSREKIDWKSAESADTVEAYDHFLERHPDGELSAQARARVAQLNEERDWKKAAAVDSADAYRQFLAQHENGKWAGEARIRVENFALDGTATGPARPVMEAEASSAGVPANASPAAAATVPVAAAPASGSAAKPAAVASTAGSPAKPAAAASTASPPNHGAPVASPAKQAATTMSSATAPSAPNHGATTTSALKSSATTPAPATSPTKPSAPAADPSTQFGIQLGAFRSQQAALMDWKRIQARFDSDLHGLFARAVPVQQTSGQLFRLQAPVGEEARARAICASLAKQSQACVVVLPQSH